MATRPYMVQGSDEYFTVRLVEDGERYAVPAGSTVKAAVVTWNGRELSVGPVDIVENDGLQDWANGLVAGVFPAADTASAKTRPSLIAISVETLGKRKEWFIRETDVFDVYPSAFST